jgi:hypothetical protein
MNGEFEVLSMDNIFELNIDMSRLEWIAMYSTNTFLIRVELNRNCVDLRPLRLR